MENIVLNCFCGFQTFLICGSRVAYCILVLDCLSFLLQNILLFISHLLISQILEIEKNWAGTLVTRCSSWLYGRRSLSLLLSSGDTSICTRGNIFREYEFLLKRNPTFCSVKFMLFCPSLWIWRIFTFCAWQLIQL